MGKSSRVANSLLALGSAAVLTVYAAGYQRTRPAADRFAEEAGRQRTHLPGPPASLSAALPSPVALPPTVESALEPADDKPAAPEPVVSAAGRSAETRRATKPAGTALDSTEPARVEGAHPAASAPARDDARKQSDDDPQAPSSASRPPAASGSGVASVFAPVATPATASKPAAPTSVGTTANPAIAVVPATSADPAIPATPPAPDPPPPPAAQYKDGTYTGWGTSRHGDIQATVVIEAGRIASATISRCLTRYSCSWIAALPPQVVSRQSPEVDYVSGATQSTNAFYYAVVEALAKAK